MQEIICAKVRAWYAGAVAVSVGCLTSVFSCKAIIWDTTSGWRVVAKATMLAACVAVGLLLSAFAFGEMRNKKNPLPYFAAISLVSVAMIIIKLFYVI